MPELPEVESARAVIERSALGRRIAEVDDTDDWVCRPHVPGEIRDALLGRRLVAAHRRGKSMWMETTGDHVLGIHLGMSGRILVTEPDGQVDEGGDYVGTRPQRTPLKPEWDRFTLRVRGRRRAAAVRQAPARTGTPRPGHRRARPGRRRGPPRRVPHAAGRLAHAGEGPPARPARHRRRRQPARRRDALAGRDRPRASRPTSSTADEVTRLHRELRKAIRHAIKKGGVHTGEVIAHRKPGDHCPRCGAPMRRTTVGGRTTWACSVEQAV